MNANPENRGNPSSFVLGMLAGSVVGAAVALWLAPRAGEEIRQSIADAASEARDRATGRYNEVSSRIGGAARVVTRKARDVRDELADAVVVGANEVARRAASTKTGSSDPL